MGRWKKTLEKAVNLLTNDALDPVAGIPEFKACAVAIERA
jgi:anaerobic selenocysteine-containing dehydrogenase